MGEVEFIDTNVLLYLISADARKADIVEARLLRGTGGIISVQVLNEFASVAVRKYGVTWVRLHEVLDILTGALSIHPVTLETHRRGLLISERYRLGLYDSLLLASAILAGCRHFLSEDLQHGQIIDGVLEVSNPFAN